MGRSVLVFFCVFVPPSGGPGSVFFSFCPANTVSGPLTANRGRHRRDNRSRCRRGLHHFVRSTSHAHRDNDHEGNSPENGLCRKFDAGSSQATVCAGCGTWFNVSMLAKPKQNEYIATVFYALRRKIHETEFEKSYSCRFHLRVRGAVFVRLVSAERYLAISREGRSAGRS